MAYDEDLANRTRELIADEPGMAEQKMFGGLAFLIGGTCPLRYPIRVGCWCPPSTLSRSGADRSWEASR